MIDNNNTCNTSNNNTLYTTFFTIYSDDNTVTEFTNDNVLKWMELLCPVRKLYAKQILTL